MLSTESRSLRTLRLLKRFSGTIEKFEKTLVPLNKKEGCAVVVRRVAAKSCESNALPAADALLMRKRRNELEMERNNLKRREAIQKKREAARRELEQMRNTAGIYDPSELVRDLENMLGYSITCHMPQPALPLPAYYKSLIKTDDMICCCDQDDQKKVKEVEEGEIVENCFPSTKT